MTAYVFDTETTSSEEPIEVIQAAGLRINSPKDLIYTDFFDQQYRPAGRINFGAMAAHHIMEEDLVDCPPSAEFKLPADATIIIGHKVDFDWEAIGHPKIRRICTMAMCRKIWPTADAHTLGAMLYQLHRDRARDLLRGAEHSAIADVKNCLLILKAIADHVGGFESWQAMWKFSEEARIPEIIAFGMHKGSRIEDLPVGYREWMLRQSDMDPYVIKAVKRTMKVGVSHEADDTEEWPES